MEITLCKNDRCNNVVPPSKNSGIKRVFCSMRCSKAYHSRQYYYRENGTDGSGMLKEQDGQQFVYRKKSPTHQAAEARYRKHLIECEISGGEQCIARRDPYDHQRECLIHAVLREDWDQLRRKARGERWEREVTTETGFWKPKP